MHDGVSVTGYQRCRFFLVADGRRSESATLAVIRPEQLAYTAHFFEFRTSYRACENLLRILACRMVKPRRPKVQRRRFHRVASE